MKTRWHLVGFLVVGSALISCVEQAIEQAMNGPDASTPDTSLADVPAETPGCCAPDPPPARTVLLDAEIPQGQSLSPVIDISSYRRVVVHTTCVGNTYAYLELRHGVAGFVHSPELILCNQSGDDRIASIDPQLGAELRIRLDSTSWAVSVTVVGYR